MTRTIEPTLSTASADATTNDTVIAAALASLPTGGVCLIPPATYPITQPVILSDYQHLAGYGRQASTLFMKNGSNYDAVVASDAWYNNRATSGNPIYVDDLGIDGNCSNNASGLGYGIIHSNYRSVIRGCRTANTRCHAYAILDNGRNQATNISNNVVECKYLDNEAAWTTTTNVTAPTSANPSNTEGASGLFISTQSGGAHGATDGYLDGMVVQGAVHADAIRINTSGGWQILKYHIYDDVLQTMRDGLRLGGVFGTRVGPGDVGSFGYEASTLFANSIWCGIRMTASGIGSTPQRGFTITGACTYSKESVAQSGTGAYQHIRIVCSSNVSWSWGVSGVVMMCETASAGTAKGLVTVHSGTGVNTGTLTGVRAVNFNGANDHSYDGSDTIVGTPNA